ncbi:hypothetical protein KRR23_26460 [Pseudomonas sp. CVAP|uniref:hypothetical protein n=1 Tax=Pseudomonas sp. CVAP\|nr:hypothetical protein [Pseudomonas sp. CVAP\
MKNEPIVASNKTPFSVLTWERLSLSQDLYTRTSITNPDWILIDTWPGGISTTTTTELRSNLYDLKVPYISGSTKLEMTNPETNGVFNLKKDGDKVTYTATSSQASIEARWGWGIMTSVALIVDNLAHRPDENPTKFHEEHSIQYLTAGGEVNNTHSSQGEMSVVVPDSTYFSFTTNTSMYFSILDNPAATIHQMISEKLVKVENRILQGFASSGGRYALTDNKNSLYPDGISTLLINDGFSESMAKIVFDHNTANRTVKISVKSHTAEVCELRDSEIVFAL